MGIYYYVKKYGYRVTLFTHHMIYGNLLLFEVASMSCALQYLLILDLLTKQLNYQLLSWGLFCFASLYLLFDLSFTYMSLPSHGSVSFPSGIPSSDLNMSSVSGCLSSDAVLSHSCKLSYLGISCASGENVNPPSSQGSQSLPCDTTSSDPSISALLACLSSNAFVSPCKLAHFGLCPAHSGDICKSSQHW